MSVAIFKGSASSKYRHRRPSTLFRLLHNNLYGKKTCRFRNLRKRQDFNKKQLTLHKMCVTSLLGVPWADLWPFYGLYSKRFSLYIKVLRNYANVRQSSYLELGIPVSFSTFFVV